jgi:fructan beta-fructosidase
VKLSLTFSAILLNLFIAAQSNSKNVYKEKYRPQFHFTPQKNWTNDPNGLVYFKNEYHLFYQYNPFGNKWGHMSWGHAVSNDLVHWKHLPLAIPEKDGIMIFSGSCVVDESNTSGFAEKSGQIPLVAIYTAHVIADPSQPDNYRQEQHIAYSLDKGRTWTKYSRNPVLDIGKKDFRDPKVFWYAADKKWVMALVLPHEHIVQFYSSKNLKEWNHLSDFGPAGDVKDIWECPDLFQAPVQNSDQKKWVLFNSQQFTVQYFVGEFDGKKFYNENPSDKVYRQDYGPDYYAVVTYNHLLSSQKPVSVGWANNWAYANDIPTWPWKSAMSLPRELSLKKINNEWTLIQKPIEAIKSLRKNFFQWKGIVNKKKILPVKGQNVELELSLQIPENGNGGVELAAGSDEKFIIGYDGKQQNLFIDRSNSSDTVFHSSFQKMAVYSTHLQTKKGKIRLHIFFDKSIIEIFANDGEIVLASQVFTKEKNDGIELFCDGDMKVDDFKFWELKSCWGK